MSLVDFFEQKTINSRKNILSNYLKNSEVNYYLNDSELLNFRKIFEIYYTPDDNEEKYDSESIKKVCVKINEKNRAYKGFSILVDNKWEPTAIIRLSGSKRTEKRILRRALRTGIQIQIDDFKKNNPLNIDEICPITNLKLNYDAQVDHEIKFRDLADEWIKKNKKIPYKYNREISDYILEEPYLKSWREFHLRNAKLRWLSKEGNMISR